MGIELQPGQPCHDAQLLGCTCSWLRGFGVGDPAETWTEKVLSYDRDCPVHRKRRSRRA